MLVETKNKVQLYKPREGGINKNVNRYSEVKCGDGDKSLLDFANELFAELIPVFKYNDGETNFFPSNEAEAKTFIELNEQ